MEGETDCGDWKIQYCRAVKACGAFGQDSDCELDVGYVECAADAEMAACASEIEKALEADECADLPDDCDPEEIADRTRPAELCDRIYDAICEWSLFCGAELSLDSCRASLELENPCVEFTAALPEAEACETTYRTLACGEGLPEPCQGVLRK